jgi:hypothetical protein
MLHQANYDHKAPIMVAKRPYHDSDKDSGKARSHEPFCSACVGQSPTHDGEATITGIIDNISNGSRSENVSSQKQPVMTCNSMADTSTINITDPAHVRFSNPIWFNYMEDTYTSNIAQLHYGRIATISEPRSEVIMAKQQPSPSEGDAFKFVCWGSDNNPGELERTELIQNFRDTMPQIGAHEIMQSCDEFLPQVGTFDITQGSQDTMPKIGAYEIIILSCYITPEKRDPSLVFTRLAPYFIKSNNPLQFCSSAFDISIHGNAKPVKQFGFFTGPNSVELLNGYKKKAEDIIDEAIILSGVFCGETRERKIYIDKDELSFYCPTKNKKIKFHNVGIAKCIDVESYTFQTFSFLEFFPNFIIPLNISNEKYNKFHCYISQDHKTEIQKLVSIYNEKILLDQPIKLLTNVKLQFNDGFVNLNPHCIGWLIGEYSPLKRHGERDETIIFFDKCAKNIFSILLRFMLERTTPSPYFLLQNATFLSCSDILYDICEHLNILFYESFLDNIVTLIK